MIDRLLFRLRWVRWLWSAPRIPILRDDGLDNHGPYSGRSIPMWRARRKANWQAMLQAALDDAK